MSNHLSSSTFLRRFFEWITDENGSFSSALEFSRRSVLNAITQSLGDSLGGHTIRLELRKMIRILFQGLAELLRGGPVITLLFESHEYPVL